MTRETVAELINWRKFIWLVGIVNPCFMLPQLYLLWVTRVSEGLSFITLGLLVFVQGSFSVHGFFLRDKPLLWGNGMACFVSILTLLSALYLRF